MENGFDWRVIGSGSFDNDGRVLALNSSRRVLLSDVPDKYSQEEYSNLPIVQPYSVFVQTISRATDDCVCIAESDAPEYLASLCERNEDIDLPQLTKASIASIDSSPLSSVCSTATGSTGSNPSGSDVGGLCRIRSQNDELSSSNNSNYSSDDGPLSHDSSMIVCATDDMPCQRSPPDIYGQTHPIESPTLIASKLRLFENEIRKAASTHSATKKGNTADPNFLIAERKCPDIVTPSFKLIFLRCECYNIANAMKRYTRYWDKRVELFGLLRAYQPITLESLYAHGDHRGVELGFIQIIQRAKSYDTSQSSIYHPIDTNAPDERNILWFDPSKLDPTQHTREAGCRSFWYMLHAYLEDVQVQQRGLKCINFSANFSSKNRDPLFTRMCFASLQGCLPIRITVFHGCHPPPVYRIVTRFLLFLIGERLRKRVIPHSGTNEQVNKILQNKFNISYDCIPSDMGGNLSLNIMEWIQRRYEAGK